MSAPRHGVGRRQLLQFGIGAVGVLLLPGRLHGAAPEGLASLLEDYYGQLPITPGRVTLKAPPLSENGSSVACAVAVDSPMTEADHVTEVRLFAGRNPLPEVVRATFTPACGVARLETRIRLADSQTLVAVARMSDGQLFSGSAAVIVTLAACINLG